MDRVAHKAGTLLGTGGRGIGLYIDKSTFQKKGESG